jgi:hypothetical protein
VIQGSRNSISARHATDQGQEDLAVQGIVRRRRAKPRRDRRQRDHLHRHLQIPRSPAAAFENDVGATTATARSRRLHRCRAHTRSGRPTGAPPGRTRCVRCIGTTSARGSSRSEGARARSLSQRDANATARGSPRAGCPHARSAGTLAVRRSSKRVGGVAAGLDDVIDCAGQGSVTGSCSRRGCSTPAI